MMVFTGTLFLSFNEQWICIQPVKSFIHLKCKSSPINNLIILKTMKMKNLAVLIAACVLSLNVMAQDPNTKTQTPDQQPVRYCAKMKDGKIMMQQDKKEMTADVTLSNGTTIKTDGTVLKSDGTQIMLKNGECIDNTGNMVGPKSDRMKDEGDKTTPR
jgi:hypothetical protein